jgi:hypothetical protein
VEWLAAFIARAVMMVASNLIPGDVDVLVRAYVHARDVVLAAGYFDEIAYHESLEFDRIQETDFLREAAWVILCSGTSEAVIRQKFRAISGAFLNWHSAILIMQQKNYCRGEAFALYRHAGKIDAILQITAAVARDGFDAVRSSIRTRGPDYLRQFAYLGPATSLHLAKNIGIDVVKPDRHLLRIAELFGYAPADMCRYISAAIGDKVSVVDTVFWRYATIQHDYPTELGRLVADYYNH